MSKRQARKTIQALKHGCTVAEFLRCCEDMGAWFDEIIETDTDIIYYALVKGVKHDNNKKG